MEQTSISNLNTKSTVDDNDYLVVDDLSSTNKILAKTILDVCKSELLAKLYPVGSIYMSVNSTSPATLFGGTWTKIATNRVLMGASSDDELGKTIESGLPNITGYIDPRWSDATGGGIIMPEDDGGGSLYSSRPSEHTTAWFAAPDTEGTASRWYTRINFDASKSNSIYGRSSVVQPPALKVNIWKRTA